MTRISMTEGSSDSSSGAPIRAKNAFPRQFESTKKTIDEELSTLAGNTLEVYSLGDLDITDDDIEALLEKEKHIVGITPKVKLTGEAAYKDLKTASASITLGNEILDQSSKHKIVYGRYFTKEECQYLEKVCVIDKKSARKIFGT